MIRNLWLRFQIFVKKLILHFIDWMEHGPAVLTIPFIPIVLLIAAIAAIVNLTSRKENL